jgi:hypothetical protein
MFGPSLKSVPGCFVSIVPIGIGVPVALTPAFLPHDDVLAEPVLELAAALVLELAAAADPPLAELVLVLLLPQPATTMTATTSTAVAAPERRRSAGWLILTSSSPPENDLVETRPGLPRRASYSRRHLYAMHA